MVKRLIIMIIFFFGTLAFAQEQQIRKEDKIRLLEAINIASKYGDDLWKGWSKVPFSTLLVSGNYEYLIYHPNKIEGFKKIGFDSYFNCDVFSRERKFSHNLLAAFNAVDTVSSIVVGVPESTGTTSSAWVITMLHEHFHQLQYNLPDYNSSVLALDLSNGDNTGMWMLNYNFPYEDEKIAQQFRYLLQSAMLVVLATSDDYLKQDFEEYLDEREKFRNLLSEKDYRYFSFQLWQEGIARYTEHKMAEMIKDKYEWSGEMKLLNDFKPMDILYKEMFDKLLRDALYFRLNQVKRVAFYTLGALEGIILDKVNPGWREFYFKEKFYIERYYNMK